MFALNASNDTIAMKTHKFVGKVPILVTEMFDNGNITDRIYYENGREIGKISVNKKENTERVESYLYYANEDMKETKYYTQDLK